MEKPMRKQRQDEEASDEDSGPDERDLNAPPTEEKQLEMLYDPAADDADEKWVQKHLGADIKTDAVLNCPSCFTPLSYACQRHEKFQNQFRAIFVLNCLIDRSTSLIYNEETQEHLSAAPPGTPSDQVYFNVSCAHCGERVGVVDSEEIFVFYNVFPSR
ncbi:putative e2f-associated phosphoprotein [Paratrimastix pyriformis]|uniref:E2f-associated phosphoprotein n=1 Tax=Paratrimastix pyriformis TaxID=342808 RepID=A0ABQ8UC33_9EUKA|nr:putative e2f-associated phosphoprotein [Paratrimastix pyriformis]